MNKVSKYLFVPLISIIFIFSPLVAVNKSEAALPLCVSFDFMVNGNVQKKGSTIARIKGNQYSLQTNINQSQGNSTCDTPELNAPWNYVIRSQYRDPNADPREGTTMTDPVTVATGQFKYQSSWPLVEKISIPEPSNNTEYTYTLGIQRYGVATYFDTNVTFNDKPIAEPYGGDSKSCWSANLYKGNSKSYTILDQSKSSINFKEATQYGIVLKFNCPTAFKYSGKISVDGKDGGDFFRSVQDGVPGREYPHTNQFGAWSKASTNKYTFIRSSGPGYATLESRTVNVKFTSAATSTTEAPTTTQPGTTELPNNSTPNDQINTGITADLGDLDQVLGSIFNPLTVWSVPELITSIIRVLFALISIAAIVIIIISGFRMVLASGNEEQLTKAKKAITWAIIGLIVSLLSFSIVSIIQNLISR